MSKQMCATVGKMEYDGLIYDGKFPVDAVAIKIKTGQGTLLRGTVLCTGADGENVMLGKTAADGETLTPAFILADDIETGSAIDDTKLVAEAYRTGHFVREKLIAKSEITDDDENKLRSYGIFISSILKI